MEFEQNESNSQDWFYKKNADKYRKIRDQKEFILSKQISYDKDNQLILDKIKDILDRRIKEMKNDFEELQK